MDKKNVLLIAGIVIVVFLIVLIQQFTLPKSEPLRQTLTPQIQSTPQPSVTSKPLSFSTITIDNQEDEAQKVTKAAEAFLITLKEKNWPKQYDRLLHDDLKAKITEKNYIDAWAASFGDHPIDLATVARVDFIKEYTIQPLGKTFSPVAVVQANYLKTDRTPYTNSELDFIYFAKNGDGLWRLVWYTK